jgi:hypothetical protein
MLKEVVVIYFNVSRHTLEGLGKPMKERREESQPVSRTGLELELPEYKS